MIGLSMTSYTGRTPEEFERWLEGAEGLGFDFVELVSEWPNFLTRETWKTYADVLGSFELGVTVHAPFSDVNIGSLNERLRRASIEVLRETLDVASRLNALVVTVHPGHCSPASRKFREDYNRVHRDSLRELEGLSGEFGVKVGVENMPSFPILDAQTPERLAELLDGIGLGVTLDVGHLNTVGFPFERFMALLGDRIVHVHLHDNSGKSDEHLPLGRGTVPWRKVLPKLIKFSRALEVSSLDDARVSLAFLRDIGEL
ncbi:sugar phosphate isomerase/epimerase family protein [Thermococcus nautili]|uniref:Sugar phosphate isomerase/epimerase n=1 Tax=Thermococcus nautili TaxID=195522 RepID=W8PKR3_9EURY|nr:sugar phosphate isomerase/epimerase family protein [Thermococcus nautili]AHL22674.1 Sugar phosphate isomerase/epimerase [Thermococcus nautili]